MARTRLALAAALVVAVVAIIGIDMISIDEWEWLAAAVILVIALFGIAVSLLLVSSLFTSENDLWETSYFRYMRAFWGGSWGGPSPDLRISVCRATWLSVWTLISWIFMIATFTASIYVTIGTLINGLYFLSLTDSPNPWAQTAMLFMNQLIFIIFGIITLIVNFWRDQLFSQYGDWRGLAKRALIGFGAATFAVILVVMPIREGGIGNYATWLAGGLVVAAVIAIAVVILLGFGWLILKLLPVLRSTVPIMLTQEQIKGWKQNFCPYIEKHVKE